MNRTQRIEAFWNVASCLGVVLLALALFSGMVWSVAGAIRWMLH